MEINAINNPNLFTQTMETVPKQTIIDINDIKSILYLGIKGDMHIPVEEKHTVDTYA
ncbi:MAG: hypothetical protein JW822_11740 [Spirochaetales bacterium]|nr:hypothetical protein [Spirochaetales bacterium]